MQATTKVSQRTATSHSQTSANLLALSGEISSSSRDSMLSAYNNLDASSQKVLLDSTGVDYINSSGIAIIIQMLLEASKNSTRTIGLFGLTPHFQKVFSMVGINKYAALYPNE